jgi:RimJ/RimL family protein N-acetyltransferase
MEKSNTISLASFTEKDFDRLITWVQNGEDAMQFAGPSLQYPITHLQLQDYIAVANRIPFVVSCNNEIIGHCAITMASDNTAVLNHILIGDVQNRNKGLGKEIVHAMLQKIFIEMQKEFAELYVFDWNIGAIKCYEHIGFVKDENDTRIREVNGKTWRAINMKLSVKDHNVVN